MEKTTRNYLFVALLALGGFLGGVVLNTLSWGTEANTPRVRDQPGPILTRSILDGPWEYRYAPDQADPEAGEWLGVEGPLNSIPGWNGQASLWLRVALPEFSLPNPVMALYRPFHGIEVWLDGQRSYASAGGTGRHPYVDPSTHLIPVRSAAKALIRVDSRIPYIGIPEPVILAGAVEESARLFLADLDDLAVVVLLILIAILGLIYRFADRNQGMALPLVVCSLVMVAYTASKTYIGEMVLPDPLAWTIVWLLSLFTLPSVFVALLRRVIPGKGLSALFLAVSILGGLGAALTIAYWASPDPAWGEAVFTALFAYRIGFQAAILLTGLFCLIAGARYTSPRGEFSVFILQAGLALFFGICASQAAIAFGVGTYGARGGIHLGFGFLLLSMAIVFIQRSERSRRRLYFLAQKADLFQQALSDLVDRPLAIFDGQGRIIHRNQNYLDRYGEDSEMSLPGDKYAWARAGIGSEECRATIRNGPGGADEEKGVRIGSISFQGSPSAVYAILLDEGKDETPRSGVDESLISPLSDREKQVLVLAAQGQANRSIGQELFISERTVKAHFASIFRKLGIGSRRELMALLLRKGT